MKINIILFGFNDIGKIHYNNLIVNKNKFNIKYIFDDDNDSYLSLSNKHLYLNY